MVEIEHTPPYKKCPSCGFETLSDADEYCPLCLQVITKEEE